MNTLMYKYACLLLQGLKLETKKYLFICIPNYLTKFKESLEKASKNYNLTEVYFDIEDPYKKHELLTTLDQENIYKHPMFDKSIYNRYAKLDAAFLFIRSEIPNLMKDVDPIILKNTNLHIRKTEEYFRSLYETGKLNWCIAAASNSKWASIDLKITEEELWNLIYKVCLVDNTTDAYTNWMNKVKQLNTYSSKLNNLNLKSLHYKNSLGTNLNIYLPDNHLWVSGTDERGVLNNIPTEEVFTSPDYLKTEGIVYSSKPLVYNDTLINNFYIEFKNGKVINYHAETGEDLLKSIIETEEHSCYLGECSFVPNDSPISNTNVIFHETLFDENAACHLALGLGFTECLKDSNNISTEELLKRGVNVSKTHVDFIIGTPDLEIIGITKDNKEIKIFENGNYVI